MRLAVLIVLFAATALGQTILITGPAALEHRLFSAALQMYLPAANIVQLSDVEAADVAASARPALVVLAASCEPDRYTALARRLVTVGPLVILHPPACPTKVDGALNLDIGTPWQLAQDMHIRVAARLFDLLAIQPSRAIVEFDASNRGPDDWIAWTQQNPLTLLPAALAGATPRHPELRLKVTGLPDRPFRLTIDGQTIGDYGRRDLDGGIDLALYDTPMSRRGDRVYHRLVSRLERWCNGDRSAGEDPAPAAATHDYELQPLR